MPDKGFDQYRWELSLYTGNDNVLVTYDPLFPQGIFYKKIHIDYNSAKIRSFYLCHGSTNDWYIAHKNVYNMSNVPVVEINESMNIPKMIETITELSDSYEIQPE